MSSPPPATLAPPERHRHPWRRGFGRLARQSRLTLAARLTLATLLLHRGLFGHWFLPIAPLGVAGLLAPALLRRRTLWALLVLVLVAFNVRHGGLLRDDVLFVSVWCLAVLVALGAHRPAAVLDTSARSLLGVTFGVSALVKLWTPEFRSGAAYYFFFLLDERFAPLSRFFVTDRELGGNLEQWGRLVHPLGEATSVQLAGSPGLLALARGAAAGTVILEALLAVAFLASLAARRRSPRWGNALLALFLLTVFPVARVTPFSWTLCAMGVAQATDSRWRLTLLATLFLGQIPLSLWLAPWNAVAGRILG